MEAVLEGYQRAYDPDFPVLCFDETTKQLLKETITPLPAQAGQPERIDYEYKRQWHSQFVYGL